MTALWIVLLTGAFAGWAVLDGANQGLGATLRRSAQHRPNGAPC